jgi:membrane-associated protease RseP (regulator of RpoE activity)
MTFTAGKGVSGMLNRKLIFGVVVMMLFAGWVVSVAQEGDDTGSQLRSEIYAMRAKSSSHARLGVMIEDVTPRLKEKKHLTVTSGAYVNDVMDESPAEKAGLDEGDVIVKCGERDITSGEELTKAIGKLKPGNEVTIEYLRKGDRKNVKVTLDRERPASAYAYSFTPRAFQNFRLPAAPGMPKLSRSFHFSTGEGFGGAAVEELSRQLAEYFEVPGNHGLLVTAVTDGSDAEKAGVKAGDVIVKVNSSSVHTIEDFREELGSVKNHEANLDVIRKGKALSLKLHVDEEMNDDDADASMRMFDKSVVPGQCSPGLHARIFSGDFVHQLLESISELKNRILRHVSIATERVKSVLAQSFSTQRANSGCILHS